MPDLSNAETLLNTSSTTVYPNNRQTACGTNPTNNVENSIQTTERYFVSLRKEADKTLRLAEAEILLLPWGPRIDVVFDPRGSQGALNGRVRLMGRTRGAREFEIAAVTISNPEQPVTLTGGFACDEYVVKASAGSDPGNVRVPESYVFARVYDGRR